MDDANLESYCKGMFRLELSILTVGSVIDKLEKEYAKYPKVEPIKIDGPEPQKPLKPECGEYPAEPEIPSSKKLLAKKKEEKEYSDKKKEYDEKCNGINDEYQDKLKKYQDELNIYNEYQMKVNKNKSDADNINNFNLKIAKPVIMSKIKLMMRCMEITRKTLDLLYQSKNVDVQYQGIVPAFVFCNYLKSRRYDSLDESDGLIAAYKKDYENNLIPMYNDIPNVKSAKQDVTELIDDVNINLKNMREIDYNVQFKINAYAAKLNEFAEIIAKEHNLKVV